ncbi:unnamed protein product [Cuscuta europaea]|uniref:Uncharacterized protein n=1 Tax=Cuscuta europaea TaxID=41803 RepID=A0A9P1EAP5_CUSEU|nr:unnamed protein product [Cuscuta europaea]
MVNTRNLAKAVSPIAPMTGKNKLKSVKKLQAQHMEAKMLDEMEKNISSTEGDEEVTSELMPENTKNKGASNTKQPPTQDVANDNTNNNIKQPPTQDVANDNTNNNIKVTSLDTNIVCENDDVLALEKVGGGSVLQNEIGILAVGNIKEVPHQSINEEIVQNEGCLAEIVKTTNASVEAVLEAVLEGGLMTNLWGLLAPLMWLLLHPLMRPHPRIWSKIGQLKKKKTLRLKRNHVKMMSILRP